MWPEDTACPVDHDVVTAMDDALNALKAAGAKVELRPSGLPDDMATSHDIFLRLLFGAFTYDRSGLTAASNTALLARLAQHPRGEALYALRGTFQSHYSWLQADVARHELRQRWAEFFRDFDVLLMPVTPTTVPPHHNKPIDRFGRRIQVDERPRPYWDQVKWSAIANVAGSPATTVRVEPAETVCLSGSRRWVRVAATSPPSSSPSSSAENSRAISPLRPSYDGPPTRTARTRPEPDPINPGWRRPHRR